MGAGGSSSTGLARSSGNHTEDEVRGSSWLVDGAWDKLWTAGVRVCTALCTGCAQLLGMLSWIARDMGKLGPHRVEKRKIGASLSGRGGSIISDD